MSIGTPPAQVLTAALRGLEVVPVKVQVQITAGLPCFVIVGMADKAVSESRERVRAALASLGLSMPPKRIVVNLSPAALPKEGSHYDLPIALGLLVALNIIEQELAIDYLSMGELGLDGSILAVPGVLPVAMQANEDNMALICPKANGAEATLSGSDAILAPDNIAGLLAHLIEGTPLATPEAPPPPAVQSLPDLSDIRGQKAAKRALEIAATGGHNLLMVGPPGSGKSMLAERLPGIMPDLTARESLELSLIRSIAGEITNAHEITDRPYRSPHHTASVPAMVGGGPRCTPGEISLAHNGVLFLDELPEFSRQTLEALRQPLETGEVSLARAQLHVSYNANFQLIAAMNPCRCGYLRDSERRCHRAPMCAQQYQEKISGPLLDRFDIFVDVGEIPTSDLLRTSNNKHETSEPSSAVRNRVCQARKLQLKRFAASDNPASCNSEIRGNDIEDQALMTDEARVTLAEWSNKLRISARSWFRMIRVARTIADLAANETVEKTHIAEALSFRRVPIDIA